MYVCLFIHLIIQILLQSNLDYLRYYLFNFGYIPSKTKKLRKFCNLNRYLNESLIVLHFYYTI